MAENPRRPALSGDGRAPRSRSRVHGRGDALSARAVLYQWDVTKTPWPILSGSVQSIVTSPPYWGLRDYGEPGQLGLEPDVGLYVDRMVEVFREARRVLREDGTLWLNIGDTYYTAKGACWNPGGNALSVHHKLKEQGAIPAGRSAPNRMLPRGRARELGLKPGDLVGVPERLSLALMADGWIRRSRIVWSKPNPMPESVRNRPTSSHEFLFLFTRSRHYFSAFDSIREPLSGASIERITQPGFDAQAGGPKDPGPTSNRSHRKAVENLRAAYKTPSGWITGPGSHEGLVGRYRNKPNPHAGGRREAPEPGEPNAFHPLGRNTRDVWEIAPEPFPGAHFATFPTELVRRCVLASTSDLGACAVCGAAVRRDRSGKWAKRCECASELVRPCLVLDPFAGAGTTLLVADRLGRESVGLELSADYVALARRRIEDDAPLFAEVEVREAPQEAIDFPDDP